MEFDGHICNKTKGKKGDKAGPGKGLSLTNGSMGRGGRGTWSHLCVAIAGNKPKNQQKQSLTLGLLEKQELSLLVCFFLCVCGWGFNVHRHLPTCMSVHHEHPAP